MNWWAWLSICLLIADCDKAGRSPTEATDSLRAALRIPYFRNALKAEIVETWTRRDLVFEKVIFQGRYRQNIPALICFSELARFRPVPAILYMPGTPSRKADLLQAASLMPRWADEGYFVLSIDRPYHGDRPGDLGSAIDSIGLARVWGEAVFDLMCAVDYIATRSEVDAERIGMLGWSMGGMETLLVAALEPRISAAVSATGHLSWDEIFAVGSWQLIFPGLAVTRKLVERGADSATAYASFRQAFPNIENIDAGIVAPLIAPRPLLLLGGESDPYVPASATTRVYQAASSAYRSEANVDGLGLWMEPGAGHQFTAGMELQALDWFDRWLRSGTEWKGQVSERGTSSDDR